MKRLFLIGIFAITAGYCADHNTFKNCSRVEFCTNFRSQQPADNYVVDPESISVEDGSNILTAILKSKVGGSDLSLFISGIKQSTFRLKIAEVDSTRYELKDVLDGELEIANFENVHIGDGFVVAYTELGIYTVQVNFSPFSIACSSPSSKLVFEGNRLAMTKNDINAPFTFGVTFTNAVQLYGLHEHCDSLALQNTGPGGTDPYRLKNLDVPFFETNSPMALYGAVPVLYGHGPTATTGIFLHNAAEQWVDINNQEIGDSQAYFMVETGTLDLFLLLGEKPVDVVRQYATLTGTAHLPQLWALGYHQCRYSYDSQDLVKEVIANFDSHDFQMDVIWLDIDYTDSFKYFTWNPNTFSDPVGLQETIASTNRKLVTIIDPHIKAEPGYNVYDGALAADLFVKSADGSVFQGSCWPGTSSWMDFLNPAARDFYGSMYSYENFVNSTPTLAGIWNDMNEPSVFDNSLENTLPADSIHFGGITNREIHNMYGYLHTMATHQGLINRDNGQLRPFVLTRSHFAGSQRYAAIWTGDCIADWPYLLASFQECLNANLLGIVFCGADVAGFIQNPDDELYQRWYQAGAWLPFFRAHSNKDAERREPYLKSEDVQQVVRNAIQTRYKHLPVWYTLFYQHTRDRDPIIRPLFYHYPEDTNVYQIDNQILVGSDILVRAVTEPGVSSVQVYFPGGASEFWVSAEGSEVFAGNGFAEVPVDIQSIPVFYRRQSVIVRKDTVRKNTAEMAQDGFTLYVTLDAYNRSYGILYLDDNTSFNYRDSADYNYIEIIVHDYSNITFLEFDSDSKGNFTFTVDQVVYKEVTKIPKGNEAGSYKNVVYTRDASGNLLKDIKINAREETVINLSK